MNIIIKTTRYELTADSRGLIEKKFGLLERFVRDQEAVQLAVEVEETPRTEKDGIRYRAEANLTTGGKLYRAEARSASLEAAVEKVRHELEGDLRRAHGRTRKLFRRGGAAIKSALRGWR